MKLRKEALLRLLCLAVALVWFVPLRAERVRLEDAKRAAMTVLNGLGGRCNSLAELTDISEAVGYQNLYVFNGREGYVVLAADNRVSPVLCFSPEGHIDADRLSASIRVWLSNYEGQIRYVSEHRLPPENNATQQWIGLFNGNTEGLMTRESIGPLITTDWGDDSPFNSQCPIDDETGYQCTTGSVATALAQIMKYWEHPRQGKGSISFNWNNVTLNAPCGETVYDWENMLDHYVLGLPNEMEINAVATLMSHCGIAAHTYYDYNKWISEGHNGSSSYLEDFDGFIREALINNFYYKCSEVKRKEGTNNYLPFTDEQWIQMIKDALTADPPRPILYAASDGGTRKAQGMVCDGYRKIMGVDYIHIKTESVLCDCYCRVNVMYLMPQGGYYVDDQRAYFGIEPDYATITVSSSNLNCNVSGGGNFRKGDMCHLLAYTESGYESIYEFDHWLKRIGDQETVIQDAGYEYSFKVEEDAHYVACFTRIESTIDVYALPEEGGEVAGGGTFQNGSTCHLSAIPNTGYSFEGWYQLDHLLSTDIEFDLVVSYTMNVYAHFNAANYTVSVTGIPFFSGTVSGDGSYPAQSQVTVVANPTSNHYFRAWIENGIVVSTEPSYTFTITSNRNLIAVFGYVAPPIATGSVITNADGSQGVVFYLNPMGTGGTMVALEDVSEGCAWGNEEDIYAMNNYTAINVQYALNDRNGYANTEAIRNQQGTGTGYAADVVDFANGWYLPTANQLRKIYGALPFIENAITNQGGTLLTDDSYWSSTEFSRSDAWNSVFAVNHASKSTNCRVRAVRDFSFDGNFVIMTESPVGSAALAVGDGVYADGAQVTVMATSLPNTGYVFRCWKEDGMEVSKDRMYTFTAHSNRHLVAEFSVGVTPGTVVTNADGSKGVVFYTDASGARGTMVALEDASEGCAWGDATDIYTINNFIATNAQYALNDRNGYANTEAIRNQQGTGTGYAADVVDFANGWYLPTANQLRKIYGALPFIEPAILAEGGTTMTEDNYWSSTEYSLSDAWNPAFAVGHAVKTSTCRVRAVHDFSLDGNFMISTETSLGSPAVAVGGGAYADGAQATVIATVPPSSGYVFSCWKEDDVVVSTDQIYIFTANSDRHLVAHFVLENSIGCVVTNPDGSKGVVFYTDPTGITGWMVALEDDSEGCPWGDNQNVLALEDQNPSSVQNMLDDLSGYHNTQVLRGWFMDNPDYAASQVDFANGWYLPSEGQLRKLYAALPLIEDAILREGGTPLSDDNYWSSSECSDGNAWYSNFAMGNTSKSSNLRVRAIHDVYLEAITNGGITFVGTINSNWSEVGNWINNDGSLPGLDDDVLITANCVMNMNATVKSVTIQPRSELTVTANHYLNVIENINNTASSRIILEDGAQLINPTEDTYVSVRKNIIGYGDNPKSSWYTISTPIKAGTDTEVLATDGYDLYAYFEQFYYWLNHKNNENNFTRLNCGSGYLYASQNDRTIAFNGPVKASNAEFYKSITNSPTSDPINGFNLIGNPFTNNINISSLSMNGTPFSTYYKIVNGSTLVVYADGDDEPIRPAEGFFVYGDAGYVCYNTPSRTEPVNGYVRLVLNQGEEMLDRTYLRMSEGKALNKAYVDGHPSLLYFNCQGQNYAVVAQRAQAYNLCFEAIEDGTFTIESSLLNTDCHYLHLIDKQKGVDIDLLSTPIYSFEATSIDAPNRFVLVLVEGAQPEEYHAARNRDLLPLLPWHSEATNQPAYYEMYTAQNDLNSGWNWWTPTVRTTMGSLQSALADHILQIQSQGDLPSGNILPGQMFKIETSAPYTFSLTGMRFTAASITVNPGPNWFGYIGEEAPIAQALNGFPPSMDDKIISQDGGFAIYTETNGVGSWSGTLTTLQPGKGYVYVSNAAEPKTLVIGE